MINVTKLPKPQVLVDNEVSWTNELMGFIERHEKIPFTVQGNYKQPEIKKCLKLETAEKCIYCESRITHIYPGDVEHILPKSIYPHLTFEWANLSLVCFSCNNRKRDYHDNDLPLLNPYVDNLPEHLRLFGPIMFHMNGSKRGELTHKVIGLNRIELIEKRKETLETFQTLIDKFNREDSLVLKDIIKAEIINELEGNTEYVLLKRQFVSDSNINLN